MTGHDQLRTPQSSEDIGAVNLLANAAAGLSANARDWEQTAAAGPEGVGEGLAAEVAVRKNRALRTLRVAGLSLLAALLVTLALLLTVSDPRLDWRREIVAFKFLGGLPGEDWPTVLRRVNPLLLGDTALPMGKPDEFEGMHLDAVSAYGGNTRGGAKLFQQHCVACHGHDGSGGAGVAFTDPKVQARLADLDIYMAITRGITGTNMPPSDVSVSEGLELTAYVRTLSPAGAYNEPRDSEGAALCESCGRIQVSAEDIMKGATRGEWLTYSGDYTGKRFSPLTQIDKTNVSQLRPRFVHQLKSLTGLQSTPLVKNGVLFMTGPSNEVLAVDLASGETLWTFLRTVPSDVKLCCGRPNRGVALLGDRVFHNTLDAHLIALDVRTGKELWDVAVADRHQGYSMTGAPLAIGDAIVVGIAGGDFGARGFLEAYNPQTGKRIWRFETVPGPGQPGHETWENDGWKTGGGATWVTGSYDPDLGLLYWGTGNPGPEFNPGSRPGDNLYTASVVALDARTGELRWHYQFTPNDGNDWDACQVPVLADIEFQGCKRKAMLFANRNCFFYVIDRETGKFLGGYELCQQNWNDGFTAEGRPIRRPGSVSDASGPLILPGVGGGPNWPPPSYNPLTELFYVKNYEKPQRIFAEDQQHTPGRLFLGGYAAGPEVSSMNLTAISSRTGEVAWRKTLETATGEYDKSGVLTTATGLVFTGDSQGRLLAFDAVTGIELWRYRLGGQMSMPPITYLHDGAQEVAVVSGGSLFVMSAAH